MSDNECWNKVFDAIIGTATVPEKKGTAEMDGEFIRYLEEAEAAPREYYEPCEDPRYYPSDEEIAELNRMSAIQEENDNVFANALDDLFANVLDYCKSAKRLGLFNHSIAEDMIENLSNNIKQM